MSNTPMNPIFRCFKPLMLCLAITTPASAMAQETYSSWKVITNPFASTGGGGIMIHDYDPVVKGALCTTDFSARTPQGERFDSVAEFDAVPVDGGILCTNGRWKMKDGSNSGTTPFRVFIKDGVKRGDPL